MKKTSKFLCVTLVFTILWSYMLILMSFTGEVYARYSRARGTRKKNK